MGGLNNALNKALEKAEHKKASLAQVKRAVHRVCSELAWEHPEEFRWTIRKGLYPCFNIGETVTYGQKGGTLRKAIIAKMDAKGAFLIDSGIGRQVPGDQIFKI
jgi:hypothetical protein